MRRLALSLVVAVACRAGAPLGGGATTGAESPRASVEQFLAAAKAQNLQAMSVILGSESGPLRDHEDRQVLERRQLIMLACLGHDQARIAEPQPAERGRRAMQVEMTQGPLTASVKFTSAQGPSDRWYVEEFDLVALQNKGFCRRP